jgi:ABC-type transporter Mla MlaB component
VALPPGPVLAHQATVQFKAEVQDCERRRVVRLAGRLQGEHAADLIRLCDESLKPVRLDLADLVSADTAGLEALVMLQSRGAELVGASPYVALQLDGEHARHIQK